MRLGAWGSGLVALALGMLSFLAPAKAQITVLSGGCGTATITQSLGYYTMNSSGQLCTTGGGGGGGLSVTDQASWTAGTSQMTPVGCVNTPTTSTLSSGTQGTVRCNNQRAQIVDVDTSGNNLYTALISATPAGTNVIGFISNDPCSQATKLGAVISLTGSGQIITGAASKKTYICAIDVVTATAQNIALVEGTGSTCATNIFGLAGGTTAATGWNFSANSGVARGSGNGTVYSPSADANGTAANVCLLLSGSGQTSGQIVYVQQ